MKFSEVSDYRVPCFPPQYKAKYVQMSFIKYIFAYVMGCVAGFLIGEIISLSGVTATLDAWFLTFTIVGQDVGDRMAILTKVLLEETSGQTLFGMSYLIGQSILEEIVKFVAFYIVFRINRPSSIREIVLMGILVGVGFATVENFIYYGFSLYQSFFGFIVRSMGHGLFSGIIWLLFGMGYFSKMRWIDWWAQRNIISWLVYYQERLVQWLWTFFGLISAAIMHSSINIFIALGGHNIAVIVMVIGWSGLVFLLIRPASGKHYGTIIRELDLLKKIMQADRDLESIEQSRTEWDPHISLHRVSKILKRFAKH